MAYTPINWQNGDTITAAKLNKMDNGWSTENTQLFSETVTTAASNMGYSATLAYDGTDTPATMDITLNGTSYSSLAKHTYDGTDAYYGASTPGSFDDYPFMLYTSVGSGTWFLITETAGEYTIAVAASALQTSTDFDAARGWSYDGGGIKQLFSETVTTASGNFGYMATLAYAGDPTTLGTLTITLNGTDYTCEQQSSSGQYWWGAPSPNDFSEYPFVVLAMSGTWYLITETAGEYTVSADAMVTPSASVTEGFRAAVSAVTSESESLPFLIINNVDGATDKTWNEIYAVFRTGVCVLSGVGLVLQMWVGTNDRYYMAVAGSRPSNTAFDPHIWRTAGTSADASLAPYKYNSNMP